MPRDTEGVDPRLGSYAALANLLDRAWIIPGTRIRFGLDPLLGLIPGLGDTATALIGAYAIVIARRVGAPPSVQMRLLLNILIDAAAGAIPLLGDIFDIAFKAHVRNRALLEQWLGNPHATRRGSRLLMIMLLLVVVAAAVLVVWGLASLVRVLATLGGSMG
jgi:hypothetical protein